MNKYLKIPKRISEGTRIIGTATYVKGIYFLHNLAFEGRKTPEYILGKINGGITFGFGKMIQSERVMNRGRKTIRENNKLEKEIVLNTA